MGADVVYVHVDDTLVRSAGTKRIPIPTSVAKVRALHAAGATMYLWSAGGADYARTTATELGIADDCFSGFLPKPTIIIDDQHITEWRSLRHFFPTDEIIL
jgi:cation transport ATPase